VWERPIEAFEPGSAFRERSTMASAGAWWHDRTLLPLPGGGTRVVGHIRFTPRVRAFGGLQAFVFQAMFRRRHRRLRRHFVA
jgi:ligand-binding SRPBCC domain-containing protein